MDILGKINRKIKSLGIRNKIYNYSYNISAKILTYPLGVRFLSIRRHTITNERKISLAITHYNRSNLIAGALRNVLMDDRINDIIIYDDCSSIEEFSKMQAITKKMSNKISIYRGEKNLGPYHSKVTAISKCKNEWAVILDSDNALSRNYVDRLYQISTWNANIIYCPSFAEPNFDFRQFANTELTLSKVKELILKNENIKLLRNLLNDGNYFINVQKYIECSKQNELNSVPAADVIVFNYSWLQQGYLLYVLDNLNYYHRIHSGSFQIGSWRNSRQIVDGIINSLANYEE
ncbi:glycosyltransferase family 2 protein [Nostoc commune]|uniref:glycosyltransferase family 2 protein n=1 Tax=Nostoc commune TaxID=1178 RepID=UPI0018C4B158|nr:glycosyltransferase family A protein [Nostoc commune]MBG1262929.1 glycosyltransferase family 2 protein [Nostoc commune BAE]